METNILFDTLNSKSSIKQDDFMANVVMSKDKSIYLMELTRQTLLHNAIIHITGDVIEKPEIMEVIRIAVKLKEFGFLIEAQTVINFTDQLVKDELPDHINWFMGHKKFFALTLPSFMKTIKQATSKTVTIPKGNTVNAISALVVEGGIEVECKNNSVEYTIFIDFRVAFETAIEMLKNGIQDLVSEGGEHIQRENINISDIDAIDFISTFTFKVAKEVISKGGDFILVG